jgi:hypothetical protein
MQPYIDKINEINELSKLGGGIFVPGIAGITLRGEGSSSTETVSNVTTQGSGNRTINNTFEITATVNPDLYDLARNIKTIIENDTEGVRTQMEAL